MQILNIFRILAKWFWHRNFIRHNCVQRILASWTKAWHWQADSSARLDDHSDMGQWMFGTHSCPACSKGLTFISQMVISRQLYIHTHIHLYTLKEYEYSYITFIYISLIICKNFINVLIIIVKNGKNCLCFQYRAYLKIVQRYQNQNYFTYICII